MHRGNPISDTVHQFADVLKSDERWGLDGLLLRSQAIFGAEVVALFLVRGDRVVMEDHVGYHEPDGSLIPLEELRRRLEYQVGLLDNGHYDGITGAVASTGEEYAANSLDDVRQDPSYQGRTDNLIWGSDRRFRCLFAVPLKNGDRTVGVLKIENKLPEGVFDRVDKEHLRKLAHLFEAAIENRLWNAGSPISERFDEHGMRQVIEGTPSQIDFAIGDPDFPQLREGRFDRVVVCGMGGSALPADVLSTAFAGQLRVPIQTVRTYELPPLIDERTLVIASSFSGTTEEVLEAIDRQPKGAPNVVAISAGGQLAELAGEKDWSLVRVPKDREPPGFQPRCATGYFVTYMARILADVGLIDDPNLQFRRLVRFLESQGDIRGEGEEFARWLFPRIPVIYTEERFSASIARIFKIKINENAKRPAFYGSLPEANHNEMIGYTRPFGHFAFFYLRDPGSNRRIHQRFDVTREVFESVDHVTFREWELRGDSPLEKIFSGLTLADWCAYALALLDELDPTPVDLVEEFKLRLSQRRQ